LWSFCNVYRTNSQQKQNPQIQKHKRTVANKKNLRTLLLRICVSVSELKKSQPKSNIIIIGSTQKKRYDNIMERMEAKIVLLARI
jgi:hypothetical protein